MLRSAARLIITAVRNLVLQLVDDGSELERRRYHGGLWARRRRGRRALNSGDGRVAHGIVRRLIAESPHAHHFAPGRPRESPALHSLIHQRPKNTYYRGQPAELWTSPAARSPATTSRRHRPRDRLALPFRIASRRNCGIAGSAPCGITVQVALAMCSPRLTARPPAAARRPGDRSIPAG